MNPLTNLALSVGETLLHEGGRLLFGLALGRAKELLDTPALPRTPQLALYRALQKKTADGALLSGPRSRNEFAKFTLKKGLPTDRRPRALAIENQPHSVDDFNGTIKDGYGKGGKRLIHSGVGVIKSGGSQQLGKINVHAHAAKRAGFHYDFVAEGVDPHPKSFEVNIPNGALKGRYAFRQSEGNHYLVVRMKDASALVAKPDIHLKPSEFLESLRQSDRPVTVEWKDDGSLANMAVHGYGAVYRSHRPEGQPYYDKLPAIEDLTNRSPVWLARRFFPGPNQEGTVLRGELHHPDGAARVGGILNALPENSIRIQQEQGPVEFYAWDIVKLRGSDVSHLPYGERRELYEAAIKEIRLFNPHLHVVPAMAEGGDPVEFYRAITNDPRGLPYSEGVVVKFKDAVDDWFKVKANDTLDVKVVRCVEGTGKFTGSLGAMVVEGPTGAQSEIGSFQLVGPQRQWIWDHRDLLTGQIAEVRAMDVNESGAIRAGVFVRFHPSKSEQGLLMYSEGLAGSTDSKESRPMMFRLKTSAGWKR